MNLCVYFLYFLSSLPPIHTSFLACRYQAAVKPSAVDDASPHSPRVIIVVPHAPLPPPTAAAARAAPTLPDLDTHTILLAAAGVGGGLHAPAGWQLERRALQPIVEALTPVFDAWEAAKGGGVLWLLFSVLLTRGLDRVERERDDAMLTLIAIYGYCSQEAVNLFLTGRAHSNVFEG